MIKEILRPTTVISWGTMQEDAGRSNFIGKYLMPFLLALISTKFNTLGESALIFLELVTSPISFMRQKRVGLNILGISGLSIFGVSDWPEMNY
jgi:hypothetical protein